MNHHARPSRFAAHVLARIGDLAVVGRNSRHAHVAALAGVSLYTGAPCDRSTLMHMHTCIHAPCTDSLTACVHHRTDIALHVSQPIDLTLHEAFEHATPHLWPHCRHGRCNMCNVRLACSCCLRSAAYQRIPRASEQSTSLLDGTTLHVEHKIQHYMQSCSLSRDSTNCMQWRSVPVDTALGVFANLSTCTIPSRQL